MATSENASSRTGLGWLPKLILLMVVVAFGYLYLSSVDRKQGEPPRSFLESIAKLSPIPIVALPGGAQQSVPAPEVAATARPVAEAKPAEAAKPTVEPKPVKETESAVFASSLMKHEGVGGQAAAQQETAGKPVEQQAASVVASPASAPAQQAPVATTSAPASAVPAMAPARLTTQMAPLVQPAYPQAAEPSGSRLPSAPAPYDWDAMAQQQARILAQYEAMRREADERMRQYWEHMRSAAPGAVPYGYPGYAPGYAPGIYPPAQ